jgi:hypothetical protein
MLSRVLRKYSLAPQHTNKKVRCKEFTMGLSFVVLSAEELEKSGGTRGPNGKYQELYAEIKSAVSALGVGQGGMFTCESEDEKIRVKHYLTLALQERSLEANFPNGGKVGVKFIVCLPADKRHNVKHTKEATS